MSEMPEALVDAQALAEALADQYGPGWDGCDQGEGDTWRDEARALLAALRVQDAADVRREVLHEHVSEMEAYSLGFVRGRRAVAEEIAAACRTSNRWYAEADAGVAAAIAREAATP